MMRRFRVGMLGLFVCNAALAQSFNVDVGATGTGPASSYGGAGQPGHWNSIIAAHNTTHFNLRDINGTLTNVRVWQYGGTELRISNDPATSGADEALLDDCQVTYTTELETCLFFYDLQPGVYEVIIYAWMPNQPAVRSYTSTDEEPGQPHRVVGGVWPGHHAELVTYSRHTAYVSTGLLRTHSGIVPGQNPALGAAFNGIQIRRLPPQTDGDLNCDGNVNNFDIDPFVLALANAESYHTLYPTCNIQNADVNGDGAVNNFDIDPFVQCLTSGCP